jgi:type I restriction enzyme S subunit
VTLDSPTNGADVKMEKHQFAKAGQVIVSEIWAKKGALGIVPVDGDGALVTSHFFIFNILSERIVPQWIGWILKGNYLQPQLSAGAFGTTGYAAVRPATFLAAKIPLPPLAAQQHLVARLDAIESRLTRAKKLREEVAAEGQALTVSLHHHLSKGNIRRLGELLRLDEEQEPIKADGSYPQVGIRSFGEGMFRKPPTLGSETTYRTFNVLRAGKLVMSQVKGWEGAVAVCPAELDGWFVSPEYRTFACREGECDPGYLAHLVKTRWFQSHLSDATRGVGARRERIRPEMLMGIEIPFPDLAGQKRALRSIEYVTRAQSLANRSIPHAEALLPSLLDRIFNP